MSELKYKIGDKVQIKSLDWYNENKDEDGIVELSTYVFTPGMSQFCGKVMTIEDVFEDIDNNPVYYMEEIDYDWTDEMIEGLVERNGKIYPYKIGDRVILKGNNRCATITDLKYNSFGNLSYYIKIDNDKDISTDCPTELLLPYDNMTEGLVEEETKPEPKFKVGDKIKLKSTLLNDVFGVIGYESEGYRITNISNGLTYFMSYSIEHYYELVEEESEKKLSDESWRYKNIFAQSQYPQSFECPQGYQFKDENGNVIEAKKIVLEKLVVPKFKVGDKVKDKNNRVWFIVRVSETFFDISSVNIPNAPGYFVPMEDQDDYELIPDRELPKTYEGCCRIVNANPYIRLIYDLSDGQKYSYDADNLRLYESIRKLLICRDAYWKIAGEEMGLDKPWSPNDSDYITGRYCIFVHRGNIICDTPAQDCVLTFPTEEMRDAFKENFDPDIEFCKEFL